MALTLSSEEEQVIKHRLLTQTTVARLNADPPLKKVAKRCARRLARAWQQPRGSPASHAASTVTRFVALADAAEKGVDRAGVAKLHAQLLRELALFEFQARPWGRVLGSPWEETKPPPSAHAVVQSGHRVRR